MRKTVNKHSQTINHSEPQAALEALKSILQKSDAVTTCSNDLLNKTIRLEPTVAQKGHTIHNGIDLERFEDKTTYLHPRPYILAYGRLTHIKGFDMLLDAFSQVAPNYRHLDLVLAGDGEEKQALETQAYQLGLEKQVKFFGQATPSEIIHLLNGCLFLVVSSRWESFGITALEGLAAGKLVLATRVGGLPEFVDDSVNQLVEPTVDGLAQGLKRWLDRINTLKSLGIQNSKRAVSYSWTQTVDRYLNVFL